MLVNFKVKTLDSQTHEFSVDNDLTVREFKSKLAEKTNISAGNQRLIFQGRVLTDERKLSDFDVNEKVLHVAERPPNAQRGNDQRNNDEPRRQGMPTRANINMRNVPFINTLDGILVRTSNIPLQRTGATTATYNTPSESFCINRITVARHMIECADNIAAFLENPAVGLVNRPLDILSTSRWTVESGVVEIGITLDPTISLNSSGADEASGNNSTLENDGRIQADVVIEDIFDVEDVLITSGNPTAQSSNRATASNESDIITYETLGGDNEGAGAPTHAQNAQRNRRTRTRPCVLGEVVALMRRVQTRLNPFIEQYQEILANDPTFEETDTEGRENAQRLFDRVSEAFHYLAHAQHAISDLMYDLSQAGPRYLSCRPVIIEQGLMAPPPNNMMLLPQTGRTASYASNNRNNGGSATTTTANAGLITASSTEANSSSSTANTTASDAESTTSTSSYSTTDADADRFISLMSAAFGNNNPIIQRAPTSTPENPQRNENTGNNATMHREGQTLSRLLQSLIGSVGGEGSSVLVHVSDLPNSSDNQRQSSANGSGSGGNSRNVTTATLPTTSTQTRSTSRPHIRNVALPTRSLHSSGSFDRFLSCNSHHIRETTSQRNVMYRRRIPESSQRDNESPRATRRNAASMTDDRAESNATAADEILRDQLADFLKHSIFEDDPVTFDTVPVALDRVVAWLSPHLLYMSEYEQSQYDSCKSIGNVVRYSLDLIIKLFDDDYIENASEFKQRLSDLFKQLRLSLYSVLVVCLGSQNAKQTWRQLMTVLLSSLESTLTGEAHKFLCLFINPSIPEESTEVNQFIEWRSPTTSVEVDNLDTDVEMAEIAIPAPISIETIDTVAAPPTVPIVRVGAETWHQRFRDDWVPVITNDVQLQAQRQSTQVPFSDAYISGMSPKRRKVVQSSKPPTELGPLIADNVSQAIRNAGILTTTDNNVDDVISAISNDSSLQNSYTEAMRTSIRERVARDSDFKSAKFPHTESFIAKK